MEPKNEPDNNNLPEGNTDDTMQVAGNTGAGEGTPEDTAAVGSAYEATIERQQETINTLLSRIDSLNAQISDYVRSTGSRADEGADPDDNGSATAPVIPEDYVYLKDLGREIGKRDR